MPQESPELKIDFADGWHESKPSAEAPRLLAEESAHLHRLAPDLQRSHDFGPVGPVDCPIAYDPVRRLAFRYVCASGFRRGDFSQLRAFSVDRGESYALKELPLSQWVLWFLDWIDATEDQPGQLFGLLAMDRPMNDQVVIEHRLFAYKLGAEQVNLRLLCRDAYKPLSFSRKRRELVFAGADGIYLLSLRGERKLSLPAEASATGNGAAFDPSGAGRVILGGDGLHLWDVERNRCQRLTRHGRHPVWAPDGRGVWYRESSADLHYYDLAKNESRKVVSMGQQRHPEFWYARPACLSPCGRFLALSLTEKVLRGVSRKGSADASPERVFVHKHALCAMDLEAKTYWSRGGFANHLRWVT